ncbi:AraC family transcriptional regulator [Ideonella sp. YS5]|uniref:AraC family transcriptional regulator n=1 Tax=Ideonella sp. YS5 TaxID=3453714 RepID=UPI003EED44F4
MAGVLWLAQGGALRCRTEHSLHILPPTLALWVAQGVRSEVQGLGGARLRRIELSVADEAVSCSVTLAGPLLASLADTLDGVADDESATPRQRLALAVAREELQRAEPLPIGIALPRSPALRRACEAALREEAPGDCSLLALAEAAHTSVRTLARRFQQELATPFSEWRSQVRLARMITLWAEGHSLGASAAAVGYANPSAMSFMVRRLVGMTPSRLLMSRP